MYKHRRGEHHDKLSPVGARLMVGSPTARSVGVALYVAQSGRGAGSGSGSTSSIVAGANGKKMMDIKEENLDVKRSME
jgi:hypothetical protein